MYIRTKQPYRQGISEDFYCDFSCNDVKKYSYGCESYFQESYYDFKSENIDFSYAKKHISFLLLKPDFFVGADLSRLETILKALKIQVIGCFYYLFSRHSIRELWRYELNTSTIDRYPLIDKLLMSGKSVFLLLYQESACEDFSQKITRLKKQNDNVSLLEGKTIRDYLNIYTGTLNFIHSPDEFIDFIREIGVLFNDGERSKICQLIKKNIPIDYLKILKEVEKDYPKINFHASCNQLINSTSKDEKLWHEIITLNRNAQFKNPNILRRFEFEEACYEHS